MIASTSIKVDRDQGSSQKRRRALVLAIIALLIAAGGSGQAQTRKKHSRAPKAQPADPVAQSKAELVKLANDHRANLEKEVSLVDEQINRATEDVEKRRLLLAQGILARRDLERSEQALAMAQGRRDALQSEIKATNYLIAEATEAEHSARQKPLAVGGYVATAALIRYLGPTQWSIPDIAGIESFFATKFGRTLPISALGQTPVHDRLGFDHRQAVDVAVHPDSVEGQALIAHLRSLGISFIAFRQAVAGSATGAHIHIGLPSHRLGR